jgi:uncharacterized protein
MPRVLVLSGPNHWFDQSAAIVADALQRDPSLDVTLSDDKSLLASGLADYDVLLLGTGFTTMQRQPDGTNKRVSDLTEEQEQGLFAFVRGGGGLVGVHGTGWCIGGEAMKLVGGHANWHPAGLEFTVEIADREHPITRDLGDFVVTDEIYMSAWDPAIHVLATATWAEKKLPMAWTHQYGQGRVFYTTLGHGPSTFQTPAIQQLLVSGAHWVAERQA